VTRRLKKKLGVGHFDDAVSKMKGVRSSIE